MGEAAAAVQRMGSEGDEEAHAGTLVLQAAAAGSPLRLLNPRGLRLQRPEGRGDPGEGRQCGLRPREAPPPDGGAELSKPRSQSRLSRLVLPPAGATPLSPLAPNWNF